MEKQDVSVSVDEQELCELFESEETLKHPEREKIHVLTISIKTVDDKKRFRFRETEVIGHIKIFAMKRFGIDISQAPQYFFLYQGRRLDEAKTLQKEHVPDKAELFLKNEPQVG